MENDVQSERPSFQALFRLRHGLASAALVLALAVPAVTAHAQEGAKPEEAAAFPFLDAPTIVGGTEVPQRRWRQNFRWVVAMMRNGQQVCGGSLVAPGWVLTAAHCLPGTTPANWQILVGTRDITSGGQLVAVDGIIPHPAYDPATNDNDIALMRLAEDVSLPLVRPATIAQTDQLADPGTRAHILGWGRTSFGGTASNVLLQARVPVTTPRYCRNAYGPNITRNMICAGFRQGGTDTCQGDSGGPLAVTDAQGRWIQVGVTSFGNGCAMAGFPGVYTRVGRYDQWITDTIRGRSTCFIDGLPSHFRTPNRFECLGLSHNDDSAAFPVEIGFPVRLAGTTFDEVSVNNNGNLTFGGAMSTYTPGPLINVFRPIIAPFFADVDTRAAESQIVYYGRTRIGRNRAFIAIWQNVGYYARGMDKLNTFQVVLIERGRDSGNFTIEFNYAQIQWETGSASGGTGGLGGNSARVGFSMEPGGQNVEVAGSGVNGALLDGGPNALISSSNVGQPGRFSWTIRRGAPRAGTD